MQSDVQSSPSDAAASRHPVAAAANSSALGEGRVTRRRRPAGTRASIEGAGEVHAATRAVGVIATARAASVFSRSGRYFSASPWPPRAERRGHDECCSRLPSTTVQGGHGETGCGERRGGQCGLRMALGGTAAGQACPRSRRVMIHRRKGSRAGPGPRRSPRYRFAGAPTVGRAHSRSRLSPIDCRETHGRPRQDHSRRRRSGGVVRWAARRPPTCGRVLAECACDGS